MLTWGATLHCVRMDLEEPLPDPREFDGIIAMGGPMAAYEDDRLPWLQREKHVIADAVRAGMPFWGVCLGAQLLAVALGAEVRPGPRPEVGMLSVRRTERGARDPVFAVLPDEFVALQWHGDTYRLPEGAVQLARSDAYEQQAFAVRRAYGLQFHLEVTSELACQWGEVPAYAASLEAILGKRAMPDLLREVAEREAKTTRLGRRVFAAWLEHVVGLTRPTAERGDSRRRSSSDHLPLERPQPRNARQVKRSPSSSASPRS